MRPLDFAVAGLILLLPVGLIMKQPDLGTSLLVMASGLFVIFFAGLGWKLILPPIVLGAIGIIILVVMEPQWCAPTSTGRSCTSTSASASAPARPDARSARQGLPHPAGHDRDRLPGGVWGKGFMQGTQTHLEFIPERTTDFIFAAFSEVRPGRRDLPGAGTAVPDHAACASHWTGPTLFSRLLAGAVSMIFFVCGFVNMGMVSGIPAGGGRAAALHQLRRHRDGDAGRGTRHPAWRWRARSAGADLRHKTCNARMIAREPTLARLAVARDLLLSPTASNPRHLRKSLGEILVPGVDDADLCFQYTRAGAGAWRRASSRPAASASTRAWACAPSPARRPPSPIPTT